MNSLRKFIGLLTASLLAGITLFSGSALGADKHYTLEVTPSSGPSPITVKARFTNAGNSSFNSLVVTAPAGLEFIAAPAAGSNPATPSSSRGTASIVGTGSGNKVKVVDINLPTGSGQSLDVWLTMKQSVPASCPTTSSLYAWPEPIVYTGSSLTGQKFTRDSPLPTTTVATTCYPITATAGQGGTITPGGITSVVSGSSQGYTIVALPHYQIANVLVDGTSVGAVSSYTFTNVIAPRTIAASFAINTYTIAASNGSGGTISPAGSTTVNSGSSKTYTITPNPGFYVAGVLVNGVSVGAVTEYAFSNVTSNSTIVASFAANTYTLSTSGSNPRTPYAGTSTNGVPLSLSFSSGAGGASSAISPKIVAPTGVTITAIGAAPAGTSFNAMEIRLPNIPVGTTVTLTVDVTSACTTSTGEWDVDVNGFQQLGASPQFNIQGNCSLQAVAPATAASGEAFEVLVTAYDGGGSLIAGFVGPVTFTVSPAEVSLVPPTTIVCGGAVPCNVTLTIPAGRPPTSTSLVASSTVGGSGLSISVSPPVTVWPGVLDCGEPLLDSVLNPNGLLIFHPVGDPLAGLPVSGWAGDGKRGLYNKDGSNCDLVNYTFANTILTNNQVVLEWDIGVQPNAAFRFSMNWQPEWADPATGLPKVSATKVKWKTSPTTWSPLVDGRACLSNQLPTPYGTLTAVDTGATPNTITIGSPGSMLAVPTAFPFPIFIGSGTTTERLLVTADTPTPGVYKVLRAQGGTTAINLAAVVNAALVMSNPLPLDNSTPVPLQMQVCLADQAFVSVPANLCTATPPSSPPPACMVLTTTVFDIGDGLVTRGLD